MSDLRKADLYFFSIISFALGALLAMFALNQTTIVPMEKEVQSLKQFTAPVEATSAAWSYGNAEGRLGMFLEFADTTNERHRTHLYFLRYEVEQSQEEWKRQMQGRLK